MDSELTERIEAAKHHDNWEWLRDRLADLSRAHDDIAESHRVLRNYVEMRLPLPGTTQPAPPLVDRIPPADFMECSACAAKPGTPTLCVPCLHNRTTINELKRLVARTAPPASTLMDRVEALERKYSCGLVEAFGGEHCNVLPDEQPAPPLVNLKEKWRTWEEKCRCSCFFCGDLSDEICILLTNPAPPASTPAAATWSGEAPTKPGWYWMKYDIADRIMVKEVVLTAWHSLCVWSEAAHGMVAVKYVPRCKWWPVPILHPDAAATPGVYDPATCRAIIADLNLNGSYGCIPRIESLIGQRLPDGWEGRAG